MKFRNIFNTIKYFNIIFVKIFQFDNKEDEEILGI